MGRKGLDMRLNLSCPHGMQLCMVTNLAISGDTVHMITIDLFVAAIKFYKHSGVIQLSTAIWTNLKAWRKPSNHFICDQHTGVGRVLM